MQSRLIPALCRITSNMSREEMRENMRLALDCNVSLHDLIIYMDAPITTDSQGREIIDTSGSMPKRRKSNPKSQQTHVNTHQHTSKSSNHT